MTARPTSNTPIGESKLPFALKTVVLVCWLLLGTGSLLAAAGVETDDLEQGFSQPPDSARPWVNWFWLDGNVTAEGITADLEAMKRVGLGGALLMDVTQDIPPGPVKFNSAQWRGLIQHTIAEAGRLGLQVSLNNAPGWSGSGGPWITPELAMQKLVWNKTNLVGPLLFDGPLPRLPTTLDFCRDIATLAFPTVVGDGAPVPHFAPKVTASTGGDFDPANLLDGNPATSVAVPAPTPRHPQYLQLEFPEPFTARRLKLTGGQPNQHFEGLLQVSDDGRTFRALRPFTSVRSGVFLDFEEVSARYYRVLFTQADSQLGQLQFADLDLVPIYRIQWHEAKAGLNRTIPPDVRSAPVPAYAAIARDRVQDLSSRTSPEGRLVWQVPKGQWTIVRLGYTPVGRTNHPTPVEGLGLECDKLSKTAIDTHFNAFLRPLIDQAGSAAGRAFAGIHIDSWEIGFQNWTPKFLEEFRQRRGYDPVPYLPAYSGLIVENPEISDRFFWDVRRTIADLLADNYAGHLAELAHQHGLHLSIEAYDNGPFDTLLYASRADVPMSEFWHEPDDNSRFHFSRSMASAAHVGGKPVVAAEAFTAYPANARWQNHPYSLKALGDAAFCEGVTRLVFHRYAHQPWLDRQPGMTMGRWGVHYERTETWWEQSIAWHQYLARCQFLLQQGRFVADVCYLTDEGAYCEPPTPDRLQPGLPPGYDYDLAAPQVALSRLSVSGGRLTLPDGLSYKVLVLPPTQTLTPKLLRQIKALAEAGATVVGPRPVKSPSLTDYPQCDREVERLATELWGSCDGRTVPEHTVGKGKIVWGKPLSELMLELGTLPDFQQLAPIASIPLRRIHRSAGNADVYFIANSNAQPVFAQCQFRITGRRPEVWHPDTGHIEQSALWQEADGHITLPLKFDPGGSLFVVFRVPAGGIEPVVSVTRDGVTENSMEITLSAEGKRHLLSSKSGTYRLKTRAGKVLEFKIPDQPPPLELTGAWDLEFPANSGAPPRLRLERLKSWTEEADPGVKYFSGTATYRRTVQLPAEWLIQPRRLELDLGRVQVIAQVTWNGRPLGTLWKPPFRVDITEAAHAGQNTIEVQVVNLWPNRLIGDEQLPDDCQWRPFEEGVGSPLAAWPKWLLEGKPSPTGRVTFATWKHYRKDSPLIESGLLGPVTLRVVEAHILE